jgi:hypothetical protein
MNNSLKQQPLREKIEFEIIILNEKGRERTIANENIFKGILKKISSYSSFKL